MVTYENLKQNNMKRKPFFSIIVPTFNRANDVRFALFCILRQSFSDYEIIVSDNCSSDNTKETVRSIENKRIRYFRNKKNVPYLQNVKNALRHAKGAYIFFHADDDFLLHRNSLEEIYKDIKKYKPGYVRVNYLCLTPDKKKVFDFNVSKPLKKNKLVSKQAENSTIISFIFDTDATFTTGIIFKNEWKDKAHVINTGLMPWVDILFFNIKQHGGYFISKPHILASWSQWVMRDNEPHHLYSLKKGKLVYETQYNYIKSKLNSFEYKMFLHNRLMKSFITILPAIKVYVGNTDMKNLVQRLKVLDPSIDKNATFWMYFLPTRILPRQMFKIIKNLYFRYYIHSVAVHDQKFLTRFKELKEEYLNT